ncbi:protein of unknown function [Beijerinckiaceae bacterium RH AL1]|jgi:hypothetical protein|nr:hypothetical protein [Beijerinckiaceae bacterium]VVB48617.1 protein of unknown function [Beijerinckiaceae bacterium RH CH11]VVB48698.1 protein of unknown function [Beijerinckiaceae bacterium RH AL8]VVC56484.1 protein of unknown function [Beijerinckiaceae bacterium RH AL1]
MDDHEKYRRRVERLEKAIQDQRAFLHRIPDPDTRERGEVHLFELIEMREKLMSELERT